MAQILEFLFGVERLDFLAISGYGLREDFDSCLLLDALDLLNELTYLYLAIFLASDVAQVLQNHMRLLPQVVVGPHELDHWVCEKLLTIAVAVFVECDDEHLPLLD